MMRRSGRQVSATIPTIGYRDRSDHPWPRILQFVAIVSIIYGASRLGVNLCNGWFIWDIQKSSNAPPLVGELPSLIQLLTETVLGLLLIIGAVTLLRNG